MIEKILPSKLSRYLIKNFLKMFLLIFLISFMIVFVINFFEFSPKMQKYSIDSLISLKIIFFRTMPIIEAIMMFILALGVNFELIRICDKSELTIIYMSNYSPWRVLKTILITAATIGILNITLFNRLSIKLYNISEKLFLESIDESAEVKYLESKYGIWLNLKLSDEEDLIIKSNKVFIDKLVFKKIDGIIISENGKLLRKITADNMQICDNEIIFNNLVYIEKSELNHCEEKVVMMTNVDDKFIKKQLRNNYEKLKLIPFLILKKLIRDYKIAGLDINKFKAKMFNFISIPFYYAFISCFIFITVKINQRNSKNMFDTLKIVLMVIFLFVVQSIISELSVYGLIYSYSNLLFSVFLLVVMFKELIKKIELV